MTPQKITPSLYNTPLEAGIRAVIILEIFEPTMFDLANISLLDYFIVHTADAGGPDSIHPDVSARSGEYFVRRHLVEKGLALMIRASLIEQITTSSGIIFRSHETSAAMLDQIRTNYNKRLIEAASWLAEQSREEGQEIFLNKLKFRIDRWSQEMIEGALS